MELSNRRVSQTIRRPHGLNHLSPLRLTTHHIRISRLRHQVLVASNGPVCQHPWLDHQGRPHGRHSLSQGRQSKDYLVLGRQDDQNLEHWDRWAIRHAQESLRWCHLSPIQWLLYSEWFVRPHYKALGLFSPLVSSSKYLPKLNICYSFFFSFLLFFNVLKGIVS